MLMYRLHQLRTLRIVIKGNQDNTTTPISLQSGLDTQADVVYLDTKVDEYFSIPHSEPRHNIITLNVLSSLVLHCLRVSFCRVSHSGTSLTTATFHFVPVFSPTSSHILSQVRGSYLNVFLCPSLTATGRTTSFAGVPPNCQPISTLPGYGFKSEIVLMYACVCVGRSHDGTTWLPIQCRRNLGLRGMSLHGWGSGCSRRRTWRPSCPGHESNRSRSR